ncbi:hypothetical protein ACNUDN_02381 [Mycobacterium sp. smrl_JER01]
MRYECGMAPKMSAFASQQRAAEAFNLRASRYSWREVAERLGYRSIGAAQSAVSRHVARVRRESTETTVESHKAAIETRTRALSQRFVMAFKAGDDDTMVTLNREIARNEGELAKLGGMYMPERSEMTVTVDQTPAAIIDRMEAELLALAAQRQPQQALQGNIIDAEVLP